MLEDSTEVMRASDDNPLSGPKTLPGTSVKSRLNVRNRVRTFIPHPRETSLFLACPNDHTESEQCYDWQSG